MKTHLARNAEIILDEFKKLEPSQNEVCASHTEEMKVVYEASDYSVSSHNTTALYGVRSIVNGRLGFATTNLADAASLQAIARESQSLAKMSVPSEHHCIAQESPTIDSHLGDQKLEHVTPKEIYEVAEKVVAEARKDPRVTLDRVEVSWHKSTRTLTNSNGVHHREFQSTVSFFAMGMAKQGDEVTSFDYDGGSISNWNDLEREILRSIGEFRESVIGSLGARSGKSYKGPVLLHPSAVHGLVAGFVSSNCSGIAQQDGMSSWKGKRGQNVMSEMISLSEDPLDKKRPGGWHQFDREGVPTAHHEIIKNGVLNFVAQNSFSAHRGQTNPTGNASGGARSLPGIGLSNLKMEAGTKYKSDLDLMKAFGSGLMFKRFSGRSDPFSGVFSGIAKNSFWIENGSIAYPVHQVMVSGNLFELVQQVLAVGPQLHLDMGNGLFPYLLVDGLTVTAG